LTRGTWTKDDMETIRLGIIVNGMNDTARPPARARHVR